MTSQIPVTPSRFRRETAAASVRGFRARRRRPTARPLPQRLQQFARLPRRATSGWSRPNGTATTGTPWASDFWVIPMPPWQTTQAAWSRMRGCGTKRSTRTLARAVRVEGSMSAEVMTALTGSPANAWQATSASRRPATWRRRAARAIRSRPYARSRACPDASLAPTGEDFSMCHACESCLAGMPAIWRAGRVRAVQ